MMKAKFSPIFFRFVVGDFREIVVFLAFLFVFVRFKNIFPFTFIEESVGDAEKKKFPEAA